MSELLGRLRQAASGAQQGDAASEQFLLAARQPNSEIATCGDVLAAAYDMLFASDAYGQAEGISLSAHEQMHALLLARDCILQRWNECLLETERGEVGLTVVLQLGNAVLLALSSSSDSNRMEICAAAMPIACQLLAVLAKRATSLGVDQPALDSLSSLRGAIFARVVAESRRSVTPETSIDLRLAQAMVVEFTAGSRASAMGATWEFHRRSASHFQANELILIFEFAFAVFLQDTDNSFRLRTPALSLLHEVLHWDFNVVAADSLSLTQTDAFETVFKPPLEWTSTLSSQARLHSSDVSIVTALLAPVVHSVEWNVQPEELEHCLACVDALASLPVRDVLRELDSGHCSLAFSVSGALTFAEWCRELLSGANLAFRSVLSNLDVPAMVMHEHTESLVSVLRGMARVLRRFASSGMLTATLTNATLLSALASDIETTLAELAHNTLAAVWHLMDVGLRSSESFASNFVDILEECIDDVLSTFVVVLPQLEFVSQEFFLRIVPYGALLFQGYLNGRLDMSSIEAELELLQEVSDDRRETEELDFVRFSEQLEAVAYLGRLDLARTVSALGSLLQQSWDVVIHSMNADELARTQSSERLSWAYMIASCVFADDQVGEVPSIPERIESVDHAEIDELCCTMRESFAGPFLLRNSSDQQEIVRALSPWSFTVSIWAMLRWISTYCTASNSVAFSQFTVRATGQSSSSQTYIEGFASLLVTALLQYSGEIFVLDLVADAMLQLSRSSVLGPCAVASSGWSVLVSMILSTEPQQLQLPPHILVKLMQALATAADHVKLTATLDMQQYFASLLAPIDETLGPIINAAKSEPSQIWKTLGQRATVEVVIAQVSRLRGLVRASISDEDFVLHVCRQYCGPLVDVMHLFKQHDAVVSEILKFFRDFAENQGENLVDDNDGASSTHAAFFESIVRQFAVWNEIHSNRSRSVTAGPLGLTTIDSNQRDVRSQLVLLRVLTGLCALFNFDDDTDDGCVYLVAAVVNGVDVVLPHVSSSVFEFPKIRVALFGLLHSILADSLGTLGPRLPHDTLHVILQTVANVGMQHYDQNVVRLSVEALGGFGRFVFDRHAVADMSFDDDVAQVLRAVFQFVLTGDFSRALLPPCAEALLPLLLCSQDVFSASVEEVVVRCSATNTAMQHRLTASFQNLLKGVAADLSFANLSQFERNLEEFLVLSKGVLAIK